MGGSPWWERRGGDRRRLRRRGEYVFGRTVEGWRVESPTALPNPDPDPDRDEWFGSEVASSADGTTALVGVPGEDTDSEENTGVVYLFARGARPLVFADQTSTGGAVTVSRVTMPEWGFVVVASADGDTVYSVSDYLAPGTATDLQIALDTPLPGSGTYLAAGQADRNGNRRFDASRVLDVCRLDADGSSLVDTAELTLEGCRAS